MFSTQKGAARLSLIAIGGLIVLKVGVALPTMSISILAQAMDSLLDIAAVIITFFALNIAARPADEDHRFGHGKVENIAAIAQAVLIFTAAILIIYSAVRRIITGTTIELTEAGIGVMAVSIIVSFFLSRHLHRVSRATDSIALEASARNITADIYSATGVMCGFVAIRFTGLSILDPIIALAVTAFILKAGFDVMRKSFGGLIDEKLPQAEEDKIISCINEHSERLVDFHKLRTRRAGSQRYIDLHLVMPKDTSIAEAHRVADQIEQAIADCLNNSSVIIHIEPCDETCEQCPIPSKRQDRR
ncbi:cation diffusion facilitator family transporter [Chloroflexota bacterium]